MTQHTNKDWREEFERKWRAGEFQVFSELGIGVNPKTFKDFIASVEKQAYLRAAETARTKKFNTPECAQFLYASDSVDEKIEDIASAIIKLSEEK